MLRKICPTDTRLRPDQRALEHGEEDLSQEEKLRLEDKQRKKRTQRQKEGNHSEPEPRWFRILKDEVTGEAKYEYVGGYWESRKEG